MRFVRKDNTYMDMCEVLMRGIQKIKSSQAYSLSHFLSLRV